MRKKPSTQVSSAKICKPDHKRQLNSLINVLKPKVFITDSSNFKRLVQELTGNGNPISFNPPPIHQEPVHFQVPIINHNIDHDQVVGFGENSFDSCIDYSSEASFPTSFATTTVSSESSPDHVYSETFHDHILESSSFVNTNTNTNSKNNNIDFPACEDIESWLLEIDNYSFNYDLIEDCLPILPAGVQVQVQVQQEVSVYGYDFPDLI